MTWRQLDPSKLAATIDQRTEVEGELPRETDSHSSPVPESPIIAERYHVLAVVATGGMGVVYQVHDLKLDEVVALKRLRRGWLESTTALERFRQEVRLARRVTHRNVARTFDMGDDGEDLFLTMEYVDGVSLAHRLDEQRPFPVDETVRVAIGIAEALEAAHGAGVMHRDLKPDNVLLCRDGRVVVTDFGIAAAMADGSTPPAAGGNVLVGTPAYMAPEQVEGGALDARVDLYALGLLLYEMLTGAPPFVEESALLTAAARLTDEVPDPRQARPRTPGALATLVRELLARFPADRPVDATTVLARLNELRASLSYEEPLHRPPPRPSERSRTIALMPLRNRGAEGTLWIADGLTEELLDVLCVVRGLRVKARSPALDPSESAEAYGARLGVELVVDGTVRTIDDQVLLRLRLTNVHDGFQVWADQFRCGLGDILVVSDQAARAIARAAGQSAPDAAPRGGADPEAVELLLRAYQNQDRFRTGPVAWLHHLEEARARSPQDARILSAYAIGYALVGLQPGIVPEPLFRQAREAAERALEIAPHLAEPWVAIARVRFATNDTRGAVRALVRALENGPSVGSANDLLGRIFAEIDRPAEARSFLRRAIWLDDSLVFSRVDLARVEAFDGHWELSRAICGEIYDRSPTAYATIAPRIAVWSGGPLDPPAVELPHPFASKMMRLYITLASGRSLGVEDWSHFVEARQQVPPVSRIARLLGQFAAELHTHAGHHDEAFAWLERSVEAGLEDLAWIDRCPMLDALRDDSRFDALRAVVRKRADAVWTGWEQFSTTSMGA